MINVLANWAANVFIPARRVANIFAPWAVIALNKAVSGANWARKRIAFTTAFFINVMNTAVITGAISSMFSRSSRIPVAAALIPVTRTGMDVLPTASWRKRTSLFNWLIADWALLALPATPDAVSADNCWANFGNKSSAIIWPVDIICPISWVVIPMARAATAKLPGKASASCPLSSSALTTALSNIWAVAVNARSWVWASNW